MANEIRDIRIEIEQSTLDDLQARLANARFPDKETVDPEIEGAWDQGIPLDYVQSLANYWQNEYDWRRCEAELNEFPHHMLEIDGVDIHFMHVRSKHENARPLLLTHGWPGSVIEFLKVIAPLTDPESHGGTSRQAYHLVIPSLPGYGFSGKPTKTGWSIEHVAECWDELMLTLGYGRYFAQGGDWGAMVTAAIGAQDKGHCAAIHLNMVVAMPPPAEVMSAPTEQEQAVFARLGWYQEKDNGYAMIQKTRPQTIGYGLADSPVGQMAWIVEKLHGWSDCDGDPENIYSKDEMLDNVMLYWLNNCAASSARLYWHSFGAPGADLVHIPMGGSIFPMEIIGASRRWADVRFKNIKYWNEPKKGGHFAAMEQPELFVSELRSCFAEMSL